MIIGKVVNNRISFKHLGRVWEHDCKRFLVLLQLIKYTIKVEPLTGHFFDPIKHTLQNPGDFSVLKYLPGNRKFNSNDCVYFKSVRLGTRVCVVLNT